MLRPRLVPPLFDSESVDRLRRAARHLPGDCLYVLELRLARGAAPIDLALRLTDLAHSQRLAQAIPHSHLPALLSHWREADGPLARLRSVWCEFDLRRDDRGLPAPVVCAKLPAEVSSSWAVDCLLPRLQGRALLAAQRRRVLACIAAIPAPARLLYVFGLGARGTDAVRLEIFGLDTAGILDHLQAVAPEIVEPVAEAVEIVDGAERIHLSYDVAADVLPRIGLEGSFPRLPRREPRWAALFKRLVERGLCTAEKRDAALAWPGYDTFWTAPAAWPVRTMGAQGLCFRALSHVKVICAPGRSPEAKVYMSCGFSVPDQPTRGDDAGSAVLEGRRSSSLASRSALSS